MRFGGLKDQEKGGVGDAEQLSQCFVVVLLLFIYLNISYAPLETSEPFATENAHPSGTSLVSKWKYPLCLKLANQNYLNYELLLKRSFQNFPQG